jgi:hypothetical protein
VLPAPPGGHRLQLANRGAAPENNLPIKFQNKIETNNITQIGEGYIIDYWIEDLSGNIVKNKISTSNQDEKSFTPKIEEEDKILIIKNVLKNVSCNVSNNSGERIILIKNSKYVPISSKQAVCTSSTSKISSSESSASYVCPVYTQNSSPPFVKIINVCNTSKENSKNENILQNTAQELSGLSQENSQIPSKNLSKNLTQNPSKITSMVIYESPNLKNRLYALIGLIITGLICTSIIVYKIVFKFSNNKKIE